MPRDFRTRSTIDGRAGDARDARLRSPRRDLNGNLIGGRDQLTGEGVNVPARAADNLKPAMGAGMAWLKAQDRMKQARDTAAKAMPVAAAAGGAALNAISPMTAAASATGGMKRRILPSQSAPAPAKPDYANNVRDGVTKYGFVGAAAKARDRILGARTTGIDERRALNPGAGNERAVGDYLDASERAANRPLPQGDAAFRPDVGGMLANERVATAKRRMLSGVPGGSPVANDGVGGRQVVTSAQKPRRQLASY